jgi:protein-S-isoprenylcysteine O-methyltransferase Ste14
MLFMAGIALVTANWFLVAFLVVSTVDLALRMPKEEQMMLDEFGDEYEAYMQRTGRLLPW